MRISTGCLLLVITIAGLAPNSEELRKMYGASTSVAPRRDGTPDSETFLLSPNIELIVQYGSDKQACIMTLEPRAPAPEQAEEHHEWLMSSVRISEILEQIAPAYKRGEKIINGPAGVFCAGSNGISSQNYENLYIRHDIRCMEGPISEKRVRVNFKRGDCPKFEY